MHIEREKSAAANMKIVQFCRRSSFSRNFSSFLFQAPCQVELENWVNSIHSACAAAFARHRGKTGTLHLLQEDIYRLEKSIDSVSTK
jgi:T-lymphoma invasion and metastasis-inducing protein 1